MTNKLSDLVQIIRSEIDAEENKPVVSDHLIEQNRLLGKKFTAIIKTALDKVTQDLRLHHFNVERTTIISHSGSVTHAIFRICELGKVGHAEAVKSNEYTIGWNKEGLPIATVMQSLHSGQKPSDVAAQIGITDDISAENVENLAQLALEDLGAKLKLSRY